MKVRFRHLVLAPACQLSENSRRHVDDEAIGTIQQGQEWTPDVLLTLRCIVQEDLDAGVIFLQYKSLITLDHKLRKRLTVKRSSIITSKY